MATKKKAVKKKAAAPKSKRTSKAKRKKAKAAKEPEGSCFVLMPFREPFDVYYESIIRPAVVAANLEPLRGDSLFTPTPIMGDIWKMIQDAKVLVAEFTGKNANVFYELGLAHAIGKPVVLLSETMHDVPFDLQQLRVILYDKDDPAWGNKLKGAMTTALEETLKSPVDAVPPMFRKKVKSEAPEDSELSVRVLELERRVASLSRPVLPTTWPRMERTRALGYAAKTPEEGLELPEFFRSGEHAVGWAIAKRRGGVSWNDLDKVLSTRFAPNEARHLLSIAGAWVP